jgi:ribose transport system permease protein
VNKVFSIRRKIADINGIVIALLLLILVVSIGSDKFLTTSNIMNVLRQTSTLGIMAFGAAFVMIGGNIDLSIGSILSLCALMACKLTAQGSAAAILIPLVVGFICGAFNGLLVGQFKFNPFIATLGTMAVFQALAFYYSDGAFLNATDNFFFSQIGKGFFYKVPIPVIILLFFFLIFSYILGKTVFGRQVFAVGGNPECARFSGINNTKITILAYGLSGLCAAISAIIFVSRQMAAQPQMGTGYEFDVIVAIVVGGIALSGGKGTIWGAILGVLFIGILKNAFILLGIPLNYQYVVMGVILIFAVGIDSLRRGEK